VVAASAYACGEEPAPPGSTADAAVADSGPPNLDSTTPVVPGDAAADGALDATAGPKRLRIVDDRLLDESGAPVRLRGANLEGVTPAEAAELADTLHMNFVRLRISFEGQNRDDADPTGLSPAYRAQVDGWVAALAQKKIWALLEMRGDDALTNDASLYRTDAAGFAAYKKAWVYLARRFAKADYIAGYGLLAEPSVNKANLPDGPAALVAFQSALMDAITNDAGDAVTPFFIGPDFNYDTMQYRDDRYYTAHAARRGRLVYEVNLLMPKPWIQDGLGPTGAATTWPVAPEPTSYTSLVTPAQGEPYTVPQDLEKIFNKRREEPEGFAKTMSAGFAPWYLATALAFRDKHRVPMVVDQFGASADAGGQLAYERSLVRFFEAKGLHFCRWSYNAGSPSRKLPGNSGVFDFYAKLDYDAGVP